MKTTLLIVGLCLFCAGGAGLGVYLLKAKSRVVHQQVDGYSATIEVVDTNNPLKSCTDVASLNIKTSDSRDETDCTGKKEIVIFHGTSGITVLDPESKTYWKGKPHTHLSVRNFEKDWHIGYKRVDGQLFELRRYVKKMPNGDSALFDHWIYAGTLISFAHESKPGVLFSVQSFSVGIPPASLFAVPPDYREVPMPSTHASL